MRPATSECDSFCSLGNPGQGLHVPRLPLWHSPCSQDRRRAQEMLIISFPSHLSIDASPLVQRSRAFICESECSTLPCLPPVARLQRYEAHGGRDVKLRCQLYDAHLACPSLICYTAIYFPKARMSVVQAGCSSVVRSERTDEVPLVSISRRSALLSAALSAGALASKAIHPTLPCNARRLVSMQCSAPALGSSSPPTVCALGTTKHVTGR